MGGGRVVPLQYHLDDLIHCTLHSYLRMMIMVVVILIIAGTVTVVSELVRQQQQQLQLRYKDRDEQQRQTSSSYDSITVIIFFTRTGYNDNTKNVDVAVEKKKNNNKLTMVKNTYLPSCLQYAPFLTRKSLLSNILECMGTNSVSTDYNEQGWVRWHFEYCCLSLPRHIKWEETVQPSPPNVMSYKM